MAHAFEVTPLLDLKAFSGTDYAGYHVRYGRQIGIILLVGANKTESLPPIILCSCSSARAVEIHSRIPIRIISFLSSPYKAFHNVSFLARYHR
jgi:hypothetical protein